jgi:hypothetical protein
MQHREATIAELKNIGPTIARRPTKIGIHTTVDLKRSALPRPIVAYARNIPARRFPSATTSIHSRGRSGACIGMPSVQPLSSHSGTWLPSSGKGSFETSVTPAPGKAVVVTFRAEPGTYKSEHQPVVSADGCSMTGTFLDFEGHRGEAIYRWQSDK